MTVDVVAGLFALAFWLMFVVGCFYGGVCMWRDSFVAHTHVEKFFGTGLILVGLAALMIPIACVTLRVVA